MFSCFAIKIIKSTEAVLRKLLPNTPGPHDTLQMCLHAPTQVGSVTQTPIQFMPHEHILPLGHQAQTHINTAPDSWSCILVLTANYSLNRGMHRPCAGSLHVMGKRQKKPFRVHAFKFIYACVCPASRRSACWIKMISESKVNKSDKVSPRREGMKMLACAAPRALSWAFLQARCTVLVNVAAFVASNSEFIYRLRRSSQKKQARGVVGWRKKKEGGAGRGIKWIWKFSACGENKEIHFPLRSILVITQRLLSYGALMNSLAKWNVNIEAWVGVKINANCLTFHNFLPISSICPNYVYFSRTHRHALSPSLSVALSGALSVNSDGGH